MTFTSEAFRPLLLSALLLSGCAALRPIGAPPDPPTATGQHSWRDLAQLPVVWNPPRLSEFTDTLLGGIPLVKMPDPSLPLVRLDLRWDEGFLGARDSALAALILLGSAMRQGGAGDLPARAFEDSLAQIGARAGVSVGATSSHAWVAGASEDLPILINLLEAMLVAPRFDTARVAVLQTAAVQDWAHRHDAPAARLGAAWNLVARGPSGWTATADSADLVSVDPSQLLATRTGRFHPARLRMGLSGRWNDTASTRGRLEELVRALERAAGEHPVVLPPSLDEEPPMPPPGIYLVDAPSTQAFVQMGGRYLRRDHPDHLPVVLANDVFGGSGFGSRLVDRVRSREGLAYSVRSFAESDYDRSGSWGMLLQTRVDAVPQALRSTIEEMIHLRAEGPTPVELSRARASQREALPTLFATPESMVDIVLRSLAWKRRDDHFAVWRRGLDTVPDAEVNAAFRRWFHPDSLRIVIAGPIDVLGPILAADPALSARGPLRRMIAEDLDLDRGPLPLRLLPIDSLLALQGSTGKAAAPPQPVPTEKP